MTPGKPKRVLLIITNLTFGGAQRVFCEHSKSMRDNNFEVFECVFNSDTVNVFPSGNQLLSLDVKAGRNWPDKIFRFLQRIHRLRKIKLQFKIDLCISHLEGADLINILSKRNEKVITWVHGSKRFDQNISGLLGCLRHKYFIPYTFHKADQVVTVSKSIKEELINYYGVNPSKIKTIYNYFDIPDIQSKGGMPLPQKYLPAFSSLPIVLFSGRFAKQKNTLSMIAWFATFVKTTSAKLVLIGDGELRDEMLQYCSTLALRTYHPWSEIEIHDDYEVYFMGFQENPFQFINRASIFILPSLWEGFPMAIGEAMACGIPVASADCPTGPKEMLTEGDFKNLTYPFFAKYGLLLPLLNERTFGVWISGVSALLEDKVRLREYSKLAIKRASDFSKKANATQVVELIESICP
jgi:glycosyltransferase involved in cell wall biosynthesis